MVSNNYRKVICLFSQPWSITVGRHIIKLDASIGIELFVEGKAATGDFIIPTFLLGYYMAGMEDRLLVERLVNKCLVPFELDPKERMKKLLLLYATVDDNASKAFAEVPSLFRTNISMQK